MSFGIYVHIPYCLQKCVYCDFATVETESSLSKSIPPEVYIERVKKEILSLGPAIGPRPVDTIYFGGGTPSAISPLLLVEVIKALRESGFETSKNAELTLEINPGTLNPEDIEYLVSGGFNRFSVGVQTFDDALLKMCHRKHSSSETRDTLSLLKKKSINYSADILFCLPTQTLAGLKRDVEELLEFNPSHVSTYTLNVPENHDFSKGQAPEAEQVEMFDIIEKMLASKGVDRYEISNFSKRGFESRHNLLYWSDQEYWGLGLSSHSYIKNSEFGTRFWNSRSLRDYFNETPIQKLNELPQERREDLKLYQALTDFFHTSLRMKFGLSPSKFFEKFKKDIRSVAGSSLEKLMRQDLLEYNGDNYGLTKKGILLSNQVFLELTFLPGTIDKEV